jgi:ABC-2 type transport system permease protein
MPIFEQGYQNWSGTLRGHAWRWLAITRHGVRAALANKWLRWVLLLAWAPAVLLVVVLCLWGLLEQQSELIVQLRPLLGFLPPEMLNDPRTHRQEVWTLSYSYFMLYELRLSMLLVLIVGPALISQDLRFNALPLYLSRPLRRRDYFLGKLGVIVAFLGAVTVVPAVIAYFMGLLFSLDLSIIRDTLPLLARTVLFGLIVAVSAGTLMLALSSLSRNSRYVALFWLAVWIGTSAVSGVLTTVDREQRQRDAWRRGGEGFNAEFVETELQAARANWRHLVSYTSNLSRIGQELMGTPDAWDNVVELVPPQAQPMLRLSNVDAMYPWTWSAAVLSGLLAISVWILKSSIRSLDRLK